MENGYRVVQDELSPEFARCADELFATSTAGGIMPITTIDGQTVGNGSIGPITQMLQDAYWARHDNPLYTSVIDY